MPKTGPPTSTAMPGDEGPGDRLDSWKEVAGYLRRDISTVQRWERREGMPVHRHVHDRQGTVYAFRPELDAWWHSRGRGLPPATEPGGEPASAVPAPPLSPNGPHDAEHGATTGRRPDGSAPRIWILMGLAAVIALVGMGVVFRLRSPVATEVRSLAVLPFEVPSGDPAQDYLVAGVTDALIDELGRVDGLRVMARGSVTTSTGRDAAAAARALGVQAVVAGTVRRTGSRITVAVTLVDAVAGNTIWSESFVHDVKDVVTLQREVTIAIAERVRGTRPPSLVARRVRAVNPDAYDALLRARYLAVRTTDADSRAAIALLERAIELDAEFAPAYGELATALVTRLAYLTPDETADLEQRAFAAAGKALSLDPDVPEAYLARGDLLWSRSQRFAHERAVQEFRRALAIHPNSDEAHRRLARVFVHLGFFDEARQHASIALAINPSNAQALNSRAQATLWTGHDEEALAILRSIPGPVLPELVEANTVFALLRIGRRDEAAAELERALRRHPDDPSGNLPAMKALMLAGTAPRTAEALIRTVRDRKAVNPSHHAAYFAALALAQMGAASGSVQWLREAADTGFPCYELFARDPLLDPIRQSPELTTFLSELRERATVLKQALFTAR